MSTTTDPTDHALLAALRADGRRSVSALARDLHLSRSAVHQRLDRLVAARVLLGFTPQVDPRRLGLGISAVVLLTAGPGASLDWPPLRQALLTLPHVEYAALVTGDADVLLLVRVADLDALRRFLMEDLHRVSGMRGTLTLLVLDEVVRRPFLLPGE